MKIFKYVILFIAFTVFGFLTHRYFFDLSLARLELDNNEHVRIFSRTISDQFSINAWFSLFIGTIPLLYLVIHKVTKIHFIYKGLIALFLIAFSGFIAWKLRVYYLINEFKFMEGFDLPEDIPVSYNLNNLNFEWYLFLGFIIGTVVSILIFRKRNQSLTK